MSETIEEKIKRLHKYIHEWAAPHHSHKLLDEIRTELEKGKTIDSEHAKLLTDCVDKLLKKVTTSVFCKCGHELQSHVNFQTGMQPGCQGKTPDNRLCACTIFRIQT